MIDYLQLQDDVARILLSEDRLAKVNIVTRHKLLSDGSRLPDQTVAYESLVYVTPRNGKKGTGIIVEPPQFRVQSPNVSGPQGDVIVEMLVLEDRMLSQAPQSGTLLSSDLAAQIILDALHHFADEASGTFRAEGNAIQPAQDWEPLHGYRVQVRFDARRTQTARCGAVTISIGAGQATLTTTTAGAQIFYTLDGSFPGKTDAGIPQSTLYEAPFDVVSGQILRAVAYKTDLIVGPCRRLEVP